MDRTKTYEWNIFDLPGPDAATFDFTKRSTMRIAIPEGSTWRMPLHWHSRNLGCGSIKCVDGSLRVHIAQVINGFNGSQDRVGSAGLSVKFEPSQRVSWGSSNVEEGTRRSVKRLIVELVADETLHRNICSAILDRDLFPHLHSTPLWLKALFWALTWTPALKHRMLVLTLWIQLQVILYVHDFQQFHGFIHFTWPWVAQPFGGRPPQWVVRLQLKSMFLISRVVMRCCYWVGRLGLGMKGEYPQYSSCGDANKNAAAGSK